MKSLCSFIFSKKFITLASKRTIIPFSNLITTANNSVTAYTTSTKNFSKMAVVENHPRIAVCQFTGRADKNENMTTCENLIKKASDLGAKVVFLPEATDYIGDSIEYSVAMAECLDGPTVTKFKQVAKANGVWLSIGVHQKSENDLQRVYNSHILIDSDGNLAACYNKIHLFDLDLKGKVRLSESSYTIPGMSIIDPVTSPVGKIGLSTCYDLRFPEMSIALRQKGAEILTFPSAFTQITGQAHWETLLRSRAIENQCYVIAAAHTGKHNDKRASYGHSMIVDPWGTVVGECKEGTDVCIAEIDLKYLYKLREEMPVQSHKRKDIYNSPIHVFTTSIIDDRKTYEFGQYNIASAQVFYRTALSFAFVNIKPVLPGHVLVSPIRKAKRFGDLTAAETSDLFNVTRKVSEICEKHFSASALTVAIQDGADAGQTVEHVHVHILPRTAGDLPFNDSVYDELQKHDKEITTSKSLRTESEMEQEALELRQYFV